VLFGTVLYRVCVNQEPELPEVERPLTWPGQLNKVIGDQVKYHRKRRDWSATQLAKRCTALGLSMSRSKVANLENGRARQEGVGMAELLILGAALGVPPALLVFPVGSGDQVPMLPGLNSDPWHAYKSLIGENVTTFDPEQGEGLQGIGFQNPGHDVPIRIYQQHDAALFGYIRARDEDHPEGARIVKQHLTSLAAARIEMHRRGWALPFLFHNYVIDALVEPLRAWGYRETEAGLVEIGPARADLGPVTPPPPGGQP
jgi:transcriptional regulator with XRE-family HTH domain